LGLYELKTPVFCFHMAVDATFARCLRGCRESVAIAGLEPMWDVAQQHEDQHHGEDHAEQSAGAGPWLSSFDCTGSRLPSGSHPSKPSWQSIWTRRLQDQGRSARQRVLRSSGWMSTIRD